MSNFTSAYGSRVMAVGRVLGFFGLIILLTPVQIIHGFLRPQEPFRISMIFHRLLMRLLGFRVRVHGAMGTTQPVLFAVNHTSYLDIPVLSALIPAAFVAKAEVADWPLIGSLAKLQHTVFVERRATRAAEQRNILRDHLAKGKSLIFFPEGTSTDGLRVLPFKSSLFSVVEETPKDITLTVQPVTIICTGLDGLPLTRSLRPFYSWYGDMTLVGHLWNVFSLGNFTVDVTFHPAVDPQNFADRKALAQYCHREVARGIEQGLVGRAWAPAPEPLQLPMPA